MVEYFGLRFLLYCFNGSQQLEVGKWGGGGDLCDI